MYHWGNENTIILLLNAMLGVSPEHEASHSLDITVAEQLLDELIEAEKNCDYKAWTKRWDTDIADDYSEQDFLSNMPETNERLGHYKSREYIGCVSFDGRYGKTYEYAWKSQYEQNVAISTLEIYEKEGVVYVGGIWISWGDDHVYMQLLNHQS